MGSSSVVGSLWHVLPVVAVLGNGVGLALDVGFTMNGRSFMIVSRGGGLCSGMYCHRNFLLQRVILPEPSTVYVQHTGHIDELQQQRWSCPIWLGGCQFGSVCAHDVQP